MQHIWHTIWSMKIYVTLFLAYESLIPQWFKALPIGNKILNYTNIGTSFDVEVARIEKATNVQSWNQL